MAGKIAVGSTIARAYGFAFGNIVNNLGAIWIPVAILYGLNFYFGKAYMAAVLNLGTHDPASMMSAMPFLFAAIVVLFVLMVPQIAALTKEALGLRTGNAFLQFPFGAAAWRMMGAYLLFYLVLLVFYVILAVGTVILSIVAGLSIGHSAPAAIGIVAFAIALFVLCAFLYISVRLSFLLPPVVVAEKSVSLIRAWELTRGNFWRIFAILLTLLIPVIAVECVYIYEVYGNSFIPPIGGTPEQLQAFALHQQEINRAVMEKTQQYWYIYYPVGLAVSLIVLGMFSGASAFAYRALVPGESTPEAQS